MENEITINRDDAGKFTDAASNLKDVHAQVVEMLDIVSHDNDSKRVMLARLSILHEGLDHIADGIKTELSRILPGVDAIRRQTVNSERYEEMKVNGFYDDEPYLEGGAA